MDPIIIIVAYLLIILALGSFGSASGPAEFFLARRRLGDLFLTGTLTSTILGASSTLGMAGLAFKVGLPGAWWMLSGCLGLLALSLIAGRIRESGCYTLPHLAGSLYDQRMRLASSLIVVVSWIGIIAVQIVASGKVLGALTGQGEGVLMAASALVFIAYTAHGGQRSVVRTDLIQLFIVAFGLIALLWIAVPGSGLDIRDQSFPTSPAMGGCDVISLVLIVGSTYLIGPDIYSRILSARDGRTASRSALRSALILVPVAIAIALLGISARMLFPGIAPEEALPVLMADLLSPNAQGLVGAAMIAAFMSSADTTLLTASSILTMDIYRSIRPDESPRGLLLASRITVVLLGFVSLAVALSAPEIISTLLYAYTVFTSGLLVPLLAGFHRERLGLSSNGALAALVGGGGIALIFGKSYPLLGIAVSAALLFGVSWGGALHQSRRRING